ncbi:MAG TPA: hypothetical protein PKV78_04675 [Methanoculleus thermophilus]|nr:hypothetical protein [Methanoculleus thermophilus]
MITSVSIPEDLQPYVKAYKENHGSFSDLVCRLLRLHFGSASLNDPAMAGLVTSDLQKQLETLQENVLQISERIDSINAQKAEAKRKQAKQFSELSTLIEWQFNDAHEYRSISEWVHECGGKDAFTRAMKVRCSLVASKGGVSVEVAKAAIIKKYPELEVYL